MKNKFSDILQRISEAPTWWDSNGTPRFGEFHPESCPNVYATEVALLRIACQGCGRLFDVELHADPYLGKRLSDSPTEIYYNDPPNVGCCLVGPTMSSISLHVVQFWKRNRTSGAWFRVHEHENIPIESFGDYFEFKTTKGSET
jgi:hypothetical protein